uniref:DNA binding protein n=1 Tax=Rhizophora mucronata TaxID=61149 RepID=A0A2P2PL46_RHIMU
MSMNIPMTVLSTESSPAADCRRCHLQCRRTGRWQSS